jgi:hypothetical protein
MASAGAVSASTTKAARVSAYILGCNAILTCAAIMNAAPINSNAIM